MTIDSYDPVLNSYLNDFKKNFNFTTLLESELFEFFSAYCVYHRDFSEHTELQDVIVAGSNDTAIDSIGFFINDIPVTSKEQVDEVAGKSRFRTDFVFNQSKASKRLNAAEIGSFMQGIREFFSERYMPTSDSISLRRNLSDYIFSLSVKMKEKPRLHLFYCYAGDYKDDATIVSRVEAGKADLAALNIFSKIEFVFLDSK